MSYGQMKVVTNGFTKIGNTSVAPAQQLDVDGQVRLSRAGGNLISGGGDVLMQLSNNTNTITSRAYFSMFGNTPGRVGEFTIGGTYVRLFTNVNSGAPNQFGSEAMRITSTGQVGIGLSNPAASSLLHVNGAIHNSGGVVTSDKRLKRDLNDFDLGLDAVLKINPVSFYYNGDADIQTVDKQVGIVAQEYQKIIPDAVGEFTWEKRDIDNNLVDSKDYLYANTDAIKYMLVNAVKEQQAMIDAQSERIAQLEESISTIGSTESVNNTNLTLSAYDLAELDQNIPNPFNGQTTIAYVVPTDAQNAQIRVFGQNGQLMKSLDIDHVGQGTITVNAQDLPSGTYSYQLIVDDRNIQTRKLVVTK